MQTHFVYTARASQPVMISLSEQQKSSFYCSSFIFTTTIRVAPFLTQKGQKAAVHFMWTYALFQIG